MRSIASIAAPLVLSTCFLSAFCASADTIVLKNGRRIVAADVTQDADHVTYQTPAGQMSVPKSIVVRVEHDDFSYSSSHADSAPPVSAPQVEVRGYEDVVHLTIHDDAIDFAYIARLESDARSGSPTAIDKFAAAHHVAAQFLLAKGDTDSAIGHYRQGLIFAPDNLGLLLNLSVLYLRESQFTSALDQLERAHRLTPDTSPAAADIAKLLGWAYYGANKLDQAIEEWKRAQRLRSDPEVKQALEKAERDKAEEESYKEGETAHFALKYSGAATPHLAAGILRVLEDDFRDIESQLDFTPPEPISVILYTGQSFADITQAPNWVGALNDGRIRIPVQGLSDVTPELARVLKHELTHSFVGQKSHGRAPTWLQEGVAQWMEGRRSSSAASALLDAAGQGIPSLAAFSGSWMGLPANSAAFAYAWSLAVVESIIDAGGVIDISRLLDRIAVSSVEDAMRDVLRTDYPDLAQQTVAYLRRQYLR
ncbi:MAG TPA: tetratricopeptide repeat protein [Candidatus Baltobacteraceae bacterium]